MRRTFGILSPLFPSSDDIEDYSNELNHTSVVDFLSNSIFIDIVDSKHNLSNIKETISINISTKPNVVENIHVGKYFSSSKLDNYHTFFHEFRDIFAWSYKEMLGID